MNRCRTCGGSFQARFAAATYCSAACRQRAYRLRRDDVTDPRPLGEVAATVQRLSRLSARLESARRGVRLNHTEAAQVAAVLRREIAGMIGA